METERSIHDARGELNLFDVKSKWNARRHNGTFYPDHERESAYLNETIYRKLDGDPNRFPKPDPLDPLIVHSLIVFFLVRNGVSPAVRFLSHWTLKYYASSAFVEGAEIFAFYLLQARNEAISLIAFLLYFISHTMNSLVCVLFISRGIFGKTPSYSWDFKISENADRLRELFVAVTNYIFYFGTRWI